jgi:hypothetical protein
LAGWLLAAEAGQSPNTLEELLEQADARMYADNQTKHAARVVGITGA